jgi:glycosyltransferase involved in cell wall biosynthesis
MENQPIISVIVPVYNTEKYLSQCIESILTQSFIDFELLLIDDGSSDRSGEICDEYAKKDGRIKVFHQVNSGVSAARNLGLRNAMGKYAVFVDSDDYVKKEYLESLYAYTLGNSQVDLVIQSVEKVDINGTVKFSPLPEHVLHKKDSYKILTEYAVLYAGYPFGKLFLCSIIKRYNIFFISDIFILEDLFFLLDYTLHVNEIVITKESYYIYRAEISTSLSHSNIKTFDKELLVFTSYFERIYKYKDIYDLDDSSLKKVLCSLTGLFHRVLLSIYKNTYSMNERLFLLRALMQQSRSWMINYYIPDYKIDKILKKILMANYYRLFDLGMLILLKIRFKKMFGTI